MQIIEWDEFLNNGLPVKGKSVSMTIGVFDGVHLGHQALIKRVVSQSPDDCVPVVVTFRSPDHKSEKPADTIQTFKEKADALEKLGVQILLVVDFSEKLRHMKGAEFLEILFKRCGISFFAIGANFRCGYQLDTDAAAIKNFFASRGIAAEIVPEVTHEGIPVSSSRIRAALSAGDTELAERMLGT